MGGVTVMVYRFLYRTPLGYFFTDWLEAGCYEEAKGLFWAVHNSDVCRIIEAQSRLMADQEGDEGADEGGDQPFGGIGEDLEGDVMTAGEKDERVGDLDLLLGPGVMEGNAGAGLLRKGVEDEYVLLVGKRDEVKVHRLLKHRLLVHGKLRSFVLKAPLEVSALAGVRADPEEVDEEICGDLAHRGSDSTGR